MPFAFSAVLAFFHPSASPAQPLAGPPGYRLQPVAAEVQFSMACSQPDPGRLAAAGNYLLISQPRANSLLLFDLEEMTPRLITVLEAAGRNAAQFDRPGGVAIDLRRGLLFVSDTRNHRIQVFRLPSGGDRWGAPLAFAKAFGRHGSGPGEFDQPGSLGLDAQANLYVIDAGNARMQVFGADLRFVRAWGSPGEGDGQFRQPQDLALAPGGDLVYVLDAGQRRVQAFAPDGSFRFAWGQARPGAANPITPGAFLAPFGIAVGADGAVYVTDCGAHVVQRFDARGHFLTSWGRFGTASGEFNQPRQIAVDGRERVIVLDFANRRGQLFTDLGRFLATFRVTRSGFGSQTMPTPLP